MSLPTRITCIRCGAFRETAPGDGTEAGELAAAQALLDAALAEGWDSPDGKGWYCPECVAAPAGPRVGANGSG
jgi:hypothetical protein